MAKKGISVGCDVQIKTQIPLQMLKDKFNKQVVKGLTMCGAKAEGYAKENITEQKAVDTGNLRNSITYTVDSDKLTCTIGTAVEYAPYIEFGTGAANYPGGTTKPSWIYKGDDGKTHIAFPQKPRPYLKPAVADHADEWNEIIENALKGK